MPITFPDGSRDRTTTRRAPRPARRGFTLVEVMISAALGSMILVAVLSTFLFIGRSGANCYNYFDMEEEARKGLERFSEDARMANNITWTSTTDISLSIPHTADNGTDTIRYYYDSNSAHTTYRCFLRQGVDPVTGVSTTTTLIHNVVVFNFDRWMLGATGQATNDISTKQLQIRLTVSKTTQTVIAATNLVVSARYILRNKS